MTIYLFEETSAIENCFAHCSHFEKSTETCNDFNMKVIGEISKYPPTEYTAIHIIYDFKGVDQNKQVVLKAITDSQEKYYGVSSMLKKALPVTWEVNYNGVLVSNNKKEVVAELN